jgi:hypothetical protein
MIRFPLCPVLSQLFHHLPEEAEYNYKNFSQPFTATHPPNIRPQYSDLPLMIRCAKIKKALQHSQHVRPGKLTVRSDG